MKGLKNFFNQIKSYPSAIAGLAIIALMIGLAIYAMIAIPYDQAVALWRGGDNVWLETPRNARPAWLNYFLKEKLPVTIVMKSKEDPSLKSVVELGGGVSTSD